MTELLSFITIPTRGQKMSKRFKKIFGAAAVLFITSFFSSCSVVAEYVDTASSESASYTELIEMARFAEKYYNADESETSTVIITRDNIGDFDAEQRISDLINSDLYFYKVALIDENTVFIQKNVFFHSVNGYVVTSEQKFDLYENGERVRPRADAPTELHYDGNKVRIENFCGEYDGLYLYSYSAGL